MTAPHVPAIYDHTFARWGHAVMSIGAARKSDLVVRAAIIRPACIIQRPAPVDGDVILLVSATRHADGAPGVLQYRVVGDVRTPTDPGDQHFCNLEFMADETNAAGGRDPRTTPTTEARA